MTKQGFLMEKAKELLKDICKSVGGTFIELWKKDNLEITSCVVGKNTDISTVATFFIYPDIIRGEIFGSEYKKGKWHYGIEISTKGLIEYEKFREDIKELLESALEGTLKLEERLKKYGITVED